MADFAPESFGKYYLVDKIATGGMAEIFKAKTYSHGGFENLVVIKRILPHISSNSDFVEMFIDEAKVSVALQHKNIVRIYDFGKIHDNYFISMECVDGKDVRGLLKRQAQRRQYIDPMLCAYIAHETCRGLHYAHIKTGANDEAIGIVHRDISPSNVIVSYEGDVKVADFGIAKAESNAYQTQDGVLKGKYEYMSPEQANGDPIDHRSDVFSVGIILYETCTGRRLFKTDSEVATLNKVRSCDFVPPRELKADLPEELERIVMKALARDPDDRYQTAAAMADDLREHIFPNTMEQLHTKLQAFLGEAFAEQIAEEKARLDAGSVIAAKLHEQEPTEDWNGRTNSTMSVVTPETMRAMVPAAFVGIVLALLLVVGVVGAGIYYVSSQETAVALPAGTLTVTVDPEAKIYLNGRLKGQGTELRVPNLTEQEYVLLLVAEGYESHEETIKVSPGMALVMDKALVAIEKSGEEPPTEPEEPAEPEPTGPPKLSLRSRPSGASVTIDGKSVGNAPITFEDIEPGKKYKVVMSMPGRVDRTTWVTAPEAGTKSTTLSLKQPEGGGKLTVFVLGGGWATVFLDGKKLPKTAPLKDVEVPPGTHEVRVVNEALGVDHKQSITVSAGGSVTVRAKPN